MRCYAVFFNDTATTEIYTLSLHDALPISLRLGIAYDFGTNRTDTGVVLVRRDSLVPGRSERTVVEGDRRYMTRRSEEHTAELQSRQYLVCRLLLEKKNMTFTQR